MIGVDIGTTRVKVAYLAPGEARPELFHFGIEDERSFAPALFYVSPDKERTILWGDDAEEQIPRDPAGVVQALKRQLDKDRIYVNGQVVSPEQLLQVLFVGIRTSAKSVAQFVDGPPGDLMLTVPVSWRSVDKRYQRLKDAAFSSGFEKVEIIDEARAAAVAWLSESGNQQQSIVVLDIGGGTVDWVLLERVGKRFESALDIPPGGLEKLGALDVDTALVTDLIGRLPNDNDIDAALLTTLMHKARIAKERAGRGRPLQTIEIERYSVSLPEGWVQDIASKVLVEPLIAAFSAFYESLESPPPVLLAGGGSRIPGLEKSLERQGIRFYRWERSDYATAIGAVLYNIYTSSTARYAEMELKDLEFLAEKGDSIAQYNLAVILLGLSSESPLEHLNPDRQQSIKAVAWLAEASSKGDGEALALLGRCYDQGYGVDSDHARALHYLHQSVDKGVDTGRVWLADSLAREDDADADEIHRLLYEASIRAVGYAVGPLIRHIVDYLGSYDWANVAEYHRWCERLNKVDSREAIRVDSIASLRHRSLEADLGKALQTALGRCREDPEIAKTIASQLSISEVQVASVAEKHDASTAATLLLTFSALHSGDFTQCSISEYDHDRFVELIDRSQSAELAFLAGQYLEQLDTDRSDVLKVYRKACELGSYSAVSSFVDLHTKVFGQTSKDHAGRIEIVESLANRPIWQESEKTEISSLISNLKVFESTSLKKEAAYRSSRIKSLIMEHFLTALWTFILPGQILVLPRLIMFWIGSCLTFLILTGWFIGTGNAMSVAGFTAYTLSFGSMYIEKLSGRWSWWEIFVCSDLRSR